MTKSTLQSGTLFCSLALAVALLSGCAKPPQQAREEPPSPTEAPTTAPATVPATPPTSDSAAAAAIPPTLEEVQTKLARIYQGSVVLDASRTPNFVAGDFNGDGSQDLAVIVKPVKDKLAEINNDVAAWLIRDAVLETAPTPLAVKNRNEVKTRPLISERDQTLLAIVHGYGPHGWRDDEAQQTYLLKNAVGTNIAPQTKKNTRAANKNRVIPPLIGDVLTQEMSGTAGFIYYTGSSYGWFDPRTYRGELPDNTAH